MALAAGYESMLGSWRSERGSERAPLTSDGGPPSEDSTRTPRLRWNGTFLDRQLEGEFRSERWGEMRHFLRTSLTVASVVFLAYGLHDTLVIPSVRVLAWTLRYAVFLPVALAVLWVVHSRELARFGQLALLSYGLVVSAVVLIIGAAAPYRGYLYTSYSLVFVTLGPFVARLNVTSQVAYTLSSLLLYLMVQELFGRSSLEVRVSVSGTLLALGGIGTVLAHRLERQARESYWQRRLIRENSEALAREQARSEALLLNVLPKEIAERLKHDDHAIADSFPHVSVLFADIVGFTRMSERLAPEVLVERLNFMFSSFDELADELELEKIKTIGDAYMVAGGLHTHHEDHAQTIAEMALGMRARAAGFGAVFGEQLDIRIGVHTGPVMAGVIGKRKFIYDVWGDTVNTASRMESHSEPGKIQASEAMYLALRGDYRLECRGHIEVKGKGSMRTWFLIEPKRSFSRQPALQGARVTAARASG